MKLDLKKRAFIIKNNKMVISSTENKKTLFKVGILLINYIAKKSGYAYEPIYTYYFSGANFR